MTTLSKVLTEEAFEHTIALATRFTEGVQSVIDENQLPRSVTKLGAGPTTARTGAIPQLD